VSFDDCAAFGAPVPRHCSLCLVQLIEFILFCRRCREAFRTIAGPQFGGVNSQMTTPAALCFPSLRQEFERTVTAVSHSDSARWMHNRPSGRSGEEIFSRVMNSYFSPRLLSPDYLTIDV
jgi:hypothetical protein